MILPQRKPGGKRGLKEGLEGSDPPPKGIKRRRKDENDDDIFRACKVCGEEAGRHSYYGGQVCASCRAFFRRSVNSGANKAYFCVKNGNCEVNSKTRKQCQYCRYRLCEDAGMKTSWVLTDTEKKLKSSEGKEGKQKRNSIDYDEVSNPPSLSGESSSIFISETELVLINELVEISDFWETSKVNDMDTTLIREIFRMVAFGSMLSEVGLAQLAGTMKLRTKNFALRLRELQQLSKQDRD
ncbi:oxysterols receptor LXR-alpha [Eurytemora carolleeae]|uniref:oxysterols receptor LXR-alpha n=1 Tax=Eurytemora carolleeae TaxID=1294199 RepID=UPI000C766136|nr:oxysterols receptor LXR-alpha [Eurytemora carolleeae]|eukprot:XP_023334818.1 oxysterols receptor LXR-alpha-like [Eurytemora affinis]